MEMIKEPREIEVLVSIQLSKTLKITTDNYTVVDSGKDEYGDYYETVEYNDLVKDVNEQHTLPQDLALYINRLCDHSITYTSTRLKNYLGQALDDCSNWEVNDIEVQY